MFEIICVIIGVLCLWVMAESITGIHEVKRDFNEYTKGNKSLKELKDKYKS